MSATFTAMNLLGPAGFLRRPLKQTCLRPRVVIVSILILSVFADTLYIPTTQTRQQSSLGVGREKLRHGEESHPSNDRDADRI